MCHPMEMIHSRIPSRSWVKTFSLACGNFFPLCFGRPMACRVQVNSVVERTARLGEYSGCQTQGGCAAIESGDESPHSQEQLRTAARSPKQRRRQKS